MATDGPQESRDSPVTPSGPKDGVGYVSVLKLRYDETKPADYNNSRWVKNKPERTVERELVVTAPTLEQTGLTDF